MASFGYGTQSTFEAESKDFPQNFEVEPAIGNSSRISSKNLEYEDDNKHSLAVSSFTNFRVKAIVFACLVCERVPIPLTMLKNTGEFCCVECFKKIEEKGDTLELNGLNKRVMKEEIECPYKCQARWRGSVEEFMHQHRIECREERKLGYKKFSSMDEEEDEEEEEETGTGYAGEEDTWKGVIYYLVTRRGKWANPAREGVVKVDSSGWMKLHGLNPEEWKQLVMNNMYDLEIKGAKYAATKDRKDSWVSIDVGIELNPTHYTLRRGSLCSWKLQGWRRGGELFDGWWVTLRKHDNEKTGNKSTVETWELKTNESFQKFKIQMTDENQKGTHILLMAGFEVYGKITN